ncbi:MAG: DUF5985 family protein [Limisphaerales bacterium]
MTMLKAMLAGAIMVSSCAIALFFLRYWKKTRDRLFGFFSVSFLLLGIERVSMVMVDGEGHTLVYLIRLAAFLLIIFAIVDKNRRKGIH